MVFQTFSILQASLELTICHLQKRKMVIVATIWICLLTEQKYAGYLVKKNRKCYEISALGILGKI